MFWLFGKKKKQQTDFVRLKEKWEVKHKSLQERLWDKHKEALEWFAVTPRQMALSSLASMLLFMMPGNPMTATTSAQVEKFQKLDEKTFFQSDLYSMLPKVVDPLTTEQEQRISSLLSSYFHMKVTPELQGIRLNRSYGYIGAEQHLARYKGDTMETHFDNPEDAQKYYSSGMAPGLGAWGYFAHGATMTDQDSLREKWYIAVPTFLAPGYYDHVRQYNDFFRYRKMLVVNPNNGRAVVADIGDSGPSEWTGKHLGGSPEVMKYLERVDGAQKGPVLYYFIDDPNDTIPLGPVHM